MNGHPHPSMLSSPASLAGEAAAARECGGGEGSGCTGACGCGDTPGCGGGQVAAPANEAEEPRQPPCSGEGANGEQELSATPAKRKRGRPPKKKPAQEKSPEQERNREKPAPTEPRERIKGDPLWEESKTPDTFRIRVPRTMGPNKIASLPAEIKRQVEHMLETGTYGSYRKLSAWIFEKCGVDISPGGLCVHARKFGRNLRGVNISIGQANRIVEITNGERNKIALATATVAQLLLFEMLKARYELEDARRAAREARRRGDLILKNRAAKQAAEGQAGEANEHRDDFDEVPARAYPTKADFEILQIVSRVVKPLIDAIQTLPALIDSQPDGSNSAGEGGLSAETEARIRAILLDDFAAPIIETTASPVTGDPPAAAADNQSSGGDPA